MYKQSYNGMNCCHPHLHLLAEPKFKVAFIYICYQANTHFLLNFLHVASNSHRYEPNSIVSHIKHYPYREQVSSHELLIIVVPHPRFFFFKGSIFKSHCRQNAVTRKIKCVYPLWVMISIMELWIRNWIMFSQLCIIECNIISIM